MVALPHHPLHLTNINRRGYAGNGGVLRKQQIVRSDQAVEAAAGLLNLQRGCPVGGGRTGRFWLGTVYAFLMNDAGRMLGCLWCMVRLTTNPPSVCDVQTQIHKQQAPPY